MLRRALLLVLLSAPVPAFAAGLLGDWARDDGAVKVRFAPCGGAVCGTVTWLKDTSGNGKVGQKVFFDFKPDGEGKWAGSAFNPEDGKTYTGKLTLSGDKLNTAGCVLAGLICKSVDWVRAP